MEIYRYYGAYNYYGLSMGRNIMSIIPYVAHIVTLIYITCMATVPKGTILFTLCLAEPTAMV